MGDTSSKGDSDAARRVRVRQESAAGPVPLTLRIPGGERRLRTSLLTSLFRRLGGTVLDEESEPLMHAALSAANRLAAEGRADAAAVDEIVDAAQANIDALVGAATEARRRSAAVLSDVTLLAARLLDAASTSRPIRAVSCEEDTAIHQLAEFRSMASEGQWAYLVARVPSLLPLLERAMRGEFGDRTTLQEAMGNVRSAAAERAAKRATELGKLIGPRARSRSLDVVCRSPEALSAAGQYLLHAASPSGPELQSAEDGHDCA